jgi:hypothetical protein
MKYFLLLALLGTSLQAFACNEDGTEGFLPENDLWISANAKNANKTMDETVFNQVIDSVETIYAPIVSSMGGNLQIDRKWTDGTVNAYAQRSGSNWKVSMFGGLARHATVTPDGFALVVCHEIGHHIGGAPKKGGGWWGGSSWASNEGQSDYFATLKCLRKVFANDNNAEIVANMEVPATLTNKCKKIYKNTEDILICQRGGMAGQSVAFLFQALRNQTIAPKFDTPDTKVVSKTNHNHPDTQCRLDTYFAGAVCDVLDTDDVDQKDEAVGVCYRANGDKEGVRPFCWFKPAAQ